MHLNFPTESPKSVSQQRDIFICGCRFYKLVAIDGISAIVFYSFIYSDMYQGVPGTVLLNGGGYICTADKGTFLDADRLGSVEKGP